MEPTGEWMGIEAREGHDFDDFKMDDCLTGDVDGFL
jgi:hypothetical protein